MYFTTIVAALAASVAAAPAISSRDVSAARRERFLNTHNARAAAGNSTVGAGHSHPAQLIDRPGPVVQVDSAGLRNHTFQTDYSSNWCGAVQTSPPSGQRFTTLQASWTVPTLQRPNGAGGSGTWYGSQWVGIDGYSYGGAILQAGTTCSVTVNDDGSSYQSANAWLEWFPVGETIIDNFPVSPGDTIYCIVTGTSDTDGNVYMKNQRTGQEVVQDISAPSGSTLAGVNAEWIYEDFSSGGLVPFAEFSDVRMSGCNAGTTNGGTNLNGVTLIDISQNGQTLCYASVEDATDLVFSSSG